MPGYRIGLLALLGLVGLGSGCGGEGARPGDGGVEDAAIDDGADAPATVAACSLSLAELLAVDPAVAPEEGSMAYVVPASAALDDAELAFGALARGDPGAPSLLDGINYRVCRSGAVTVALPRDPSTGGPRMAVRSGGGTAVVLEAPHPLFDSDTDRQATAMFDRLGARGLIVAGTHRCANPDQPAGCDGTTGVCGSSAYPISDQAHTEQSLFHRAHLAFDRELAPTLVVSVHGMQGSGAHLSDGTTNPVAAGSAVADIAVALEERFPGESIESCNPFPGAATTDALCGTTNVQGRHINGSGAPCTDAAAEASGRFLHLEQSRALRDRADQVADAIAAGL